MLFNSFPFLLLFLPIVLGISLKLKGQALLIWLTLASFTFYAYAGHSWFLIPMLITTVLDFYIAPLLERTQQTWKRRFLLGISLIGNLGLLFYFKYSGLILLTCQDSILKWFGIQWGHQLLSFLSVALPAGISFYTFQTLSYIIDVYRRTAHAEKNFWKFACFVSFFPHLIAGPLTRHYQLIPALSKLKEEGIHPRWREGLFVFVIGLNKKILFADRIAILVDSYVVDVRSMTFMTAWLAFLGYSFQIYFDFSAYSDMAIGLARFFGIELPQNFNSPYKALNPSDFWRRWHITLSQWLRDYLYIPLGGNRHGTARLLMNVLITMFLGGLWHGAHWIFAIWGLYHGGLLILYHLSQSYWDRTYIFFQRIITFLLISLGWIFFRANNFSDSKIWLQKALGLSGFHYPAMGSPVEIVFWLILGLVITQTLPNASSFKGFRTLAVPYQIGLGALTALAVLFLNYSSRFLYYQF